MSDIRYKRGYLGARVLGVLALLALLSLLPCFVGAAPREANRSLVGRDRPGGSSGHASLSGTHRLEISAGYWDSGSRQKLFPGKYVGEMNTVNDVSGAFSYSYWGHDRLATFVTIKGLAAEITSIDRGPRTDEAAVVVTSAVFGVRLYPVASESFPIRPYVSAGVGPYLGIESHREYLDCEYRCDATTRTLGAFGGLVGGGLDIRVGRHVMTGIQVGYNVMSDFREPLGTDRNYSGAEFSAGISLLLGGSD